MQDQQAATQKEQHRESIPHIKNIISLLNKNAHMHRMHDVFRDFVAMIAITLSNRVDKVHYEEREAEYMKIVKKYSTEEVQRFSQAFAELILAYDTGGFDDILGSLYMQLELGNERAGQFFTPYHVCRMMAKLSGPSKESFDSNINKYGFIKTNEPCVGAGAMMIALAEEMHLNGINYQQCLHVNASDIDITAVHMAYIQFTMYHIPAVITWGNTLTLETWGHWYTLAHCMGRWDERLEATERIERMINFMKQADSPADDNVIIDEPVQELTKTTEPEQPVTTGEQITLF